MLVSIFRVCDSSGECALRSHAAARRVRCFLEPASRVFVTICGQRCASCVRERHVGAPVRLRRRSIDRSANASLRSGLLVLSARREYRDPPSGKRHRGPPGSEQAGGARSSAAHRSSPMAFQRPGTPGAAGRALPNDLAARTRRHRSTRANYPRAAGANRHWAALKVTSRASA